MAPSPELKLSLGVGPLASQPEGASDVFTAITVQPQRVTPASVPFMYTSMTPVASTLIGLRFYSLGSGSVWIAAKQFAPEAPDSSYFGLHIDSGEMRFSNPLFNTGDPFVEVSLILSSTTSGPSSSTGALRDASVTVPVNVEFQFNLTNATLLSASNSNITIWGTSVGLQYESAQAFYETTFERIHFPFLPGVSSFQALQTTSSLVKFSRTAPIQSGSWCLPLTITSTATFGEASGGGGMSIILNPGISVLPLGRTNATACGVFTCIVEPSKFLAQGESATTSSLPEIITLRLDGGTDSPQPLPKSSLTLRTYNISPFQYVSQSDGTEGWAILIHSSASLSKPRTINGARVPMGGDGVLNLIQTGSTGPATASIFAGATDKSDSQSFALKNLLLQAGAQRSLNITGTYVGGEITSGTLTLTSALLFALPLLPDPYATNIATAPVIDGSIGDMILTVTWDADPTHEPVFDLSLPPSALRRVTVAPTDPQISRIQRVLIDGSLALEPQGPILLDLSTNVSQLGVSFSQTQQENQIADLSLQGNAANMQVFALPAVQWEPMVAEPSEDRYSFIYSGPPTIIASNSVTLVPVAPREAVDEIINAYSTSNAAVTASFSLPFGLVAVAKLQRSLSDPRFEVGPVKPVFEKPSATGGDQISLRVESVSASKSLSLPGQSSALSAAVINNTGSNISAIDIDSTSNFISSKYDDAFTSSVPVSRVDLSGYGESIFSDWLSTAGDEPGVTKVSFDVMVGRTAREVVQVRSVMAPYAVRVVRTITIERLNSSIVVRSDSGWQAVGDGTYQFPVNATHPINTHPGVVTKATNVRNIRDIKNPTTPGLVNFDCTLILENSLGPVETQAINQLGYVYEGNPDGTPGPFSPQDYEIVLSTNPLGGPVDCNIDVAGSGMQMRITKISVAPTTGVNAQSDPEFCVAANGAPVLPGGGQWSFIRTSARLGVSAPVDKDQGVPLTRLGLSMTSIPPTNPYKFADPTDILSSVPHFDYGILHATDSHRTLFPRPIINAEAAIKSITSELPPVIADSFALGSSSSIFPDLVNCIPLMSTAAGPAIYNLKILAENNLHLDDIQNFALDPVTRILQGDDNFKSAVRTAGAIVNGVEDATPASVNLLLNSAAKTWNMDVSKLSMLNLGQDGAELSRIAGSIQSAESELMAFGSGLASDLSKAPQLIFGAALQEVQKVVAFLSSLGVLPALKVAMTNTWALTIGTSMGLEEFLAKIPPGPAQDFVADFITQFDLALKAVTSLTGADFKFTLKLGVKVPTSFGPTALGLAGFSLNVGTASGVAVNLDLGVGIGVGFDAGPFHALGYFGYTQSVYKASNAWGLGSTATVKAHVDLVVASADLCIEATIALVSGTCTSDPNEENTIWGYAQVTVAIDVSIFWVVNVHVHEHAEWDNQFKGHCALTDLTHGVGA